MMKRVAVFGNAGGGKSTLARRLAEASGLPLYVLDMMQFGKGGVQVPHDEFLRSHSEIMGRDEWIVDGYGCHETLWPRLESADTLIYIDLPIALHYLWVTKRFVKGVFVAPEGWPEGSPLVSSTLSSYKVLWRCHRRLTPRYRSYVSEAARTKRVFHLRSRREIRQFLRSIEQD